MTYASHRLLPLLIVALGMSAVPRAQTSSTAAVMLEKAIQQELVDGDLRGAIESLERILGRFPDDRSVSARALWHLGRSYEQLGDSRARQTYDRLLREYADDSLATRARARLAALLDEDAEEQPSEVHVREIWTRPEPYTPTRAQNQVIFSDLAVFNRQTGETRRLTASARATAYPVVSPDGQLVAYLSWSGDLKERLNNESNDRGLARVGAELRMVRLDGTGDRPLFQSTSMPWLRPFAWSPDGKQILTVVERRNQTREIALVGVTDGAFRTLTSLPWLSPQGMGFSPDGDYIAYEVATPRNPRQLDFFILPVEGNGGPAIERRYSLALGAQRAAAAPSEEQLAIHALNRLGFGPRPGDLERVRSMGFEAFIEQQLHPERIPDPVVDAKLSTFTSLKMSIPELLEKAGPVLPEAARRRATIFDRAELATRAGVIPPMLGATAADSTEARRLMLRDRPRDVEAHTARLIRAVHSERQLFEVMVDFWMNHFSVNLGDHQMTPHFEEQAIRRHTLGRFEDLLMAVSKHPRMLYYLDNWRSSAPADVVQKRVAALKASASPEQYLALLERQPFLDANKGLNENFARELMELHTLGVDGGYTQQDVGEVAKVLTGWTISGKGLVNGREDDGVFAFDPVMHVEGNKTVLGQTIRGGGIEEGEQLLKMLAAHPSTARFISTKLARRFIADDPPPAVVEAAARTFQQTGGDMRRVLETILTSPQFRSIDAYQSKIKKPLELVVSSLRAGGAEFLDYNAYGPFFQGAGVRGGLLGRMGERLYNYEAPDGNPDVGSAWMNSNALLSRLDFANTLAAGRLTGVTINLRATQQLLEQLGLPRPTQAQLEQTRAMMQKSLAAATQPAGMQSSMMMAPGGAAAAAAPPIDPAALAVAAMLGSPQFQKR